MSLEHFDNSQHSFRPCQFKIGRNFTRLKQILLPFNVCVSVSHDGQKQYPSRTSQPKEWLTPSSNHGWKTSSAIQLSLLTVDTSYNQEFSAVLLHYQESHKSKRSSTTHKQMAWTSDFNDNWKLHCQLQMFHSEPTHSHSCYLVFAMQWELILDKLQLK